MAHIVDSKLAAAPPDFNYIQLRKLTYIDANGATRYWETAARSHKGSHCEERSHSADVSDSDVAVVIATIFYRRSGKQPELLLMKQFRPAVNAEVVEFVAGLCCVDGGDVVSCANRELLEKVGYTGAEHVVNVSSRPMAIDSGFSSCTASVVVAEIDGDHPQNPQAFRNLRCVKSHSGDADDRLSAVRLPIHNLVAELHALEREGCVIGSMVWAYAYGRASLLGGHSVAVECPQNLDRRPFPPRQRTEPSEQAPECVKKVAKPKHGSLGQARVSSSLVFLNDPMQVVVRTAAALAALYIAVKSLGTKGR